MRRFIFLAFVALIASSCGSKLKLLTLSSTEDLTDLAFVSHLDIPKGYVSPCSIAENYAPQIEYPLEYYTQIVRLNVHFMDADSAKYNFNRVEGETFFKDMMDNATMRLKVNEKMNLPDGNDTPVLPANYSYQLTDMETEVGLSPYAFHKDDELYWFLSRGGMRNNHKRNVIDKYKVADDTVLNVFILPTHPDSVASDTYHTTIGGIALGNCIKIVGMYELGKPYWEYATNLNHEIAHVLGLGHSWYKNDGCDDTPPNANCWSKTGKAPCDETNSNNLMDYNASQMALTPCQIGKIHRNFSNLEARQRKLLVPIWCDFDESQDIIIVNDRIWDASKDIRNTIIIKDGASLTINCRVSMAAGSKIVVEPGGLLVLNQSMLHNSCGDTWQGIEVQQKGKNSGKVEMYGVCQINDVLKN